MAIYLTVDGGTTNTRVYLVREGTVVDMKRLSVGVRVGVASLKVALREAFLELLAANSLRESDVTRVLASGMITSEYGLCNLSHLVLPIGKEKLKKELFETVLADITSIPFCFVRGVKTACDSLENADIMRGEETELMGIMETCNVSTLYVLPGSHSKHVRVDSVGRICDFQTMMTGELFSAIMQNTILRDAVDFAHTELRTKELLDGYRYCQAKGLNEASFKTRILRNVFGADQHACYSFLLGAVLCGEIDAILRAKEELVVLGGQKQLRVAMGMILNTLGDCRCRVLTDEAVECSTARGAVRIYEHMAN